MHPSIIQEEAGKYNEVVFPPRLLSIISLQFMDTNVLSIVYPHECGVDSLYECGVFRSENKKLIYVKF